MSSEGRNRAVRWQALLQGADDAIFLLDRRRRLLFVNPAFERLTDLSLSRARGLFCRKSSAVPVDAPREDHIAHLLSPPAEALNGRSCQERRLLPGAGWVDVDFLPLLQDKAGHLILGRLVPLLGDLSPDLSLTEPLLALRQARAGEYCFHLLEPWGELIQRQARLAAGLSCPVLIQAPRGAGRGTLARVLHYNGPQREQPLACLDCSRLPPHTIGRLLFHERGEHAPVAYYLREPGYLPADVQAELADQLRREAGPRLYAARDPDASPLLPALRDQLEVFVIHLPPLRERLSALPSFLEAIIARLNQPSGFQIIGIAAPALEVLRSHDWPGNLRELFVTLRTARDRAASAGGAAGWIEREHLPLGLRVGSEPAPPAPRIVPLEHVLEQAERRMIELALQRTEGNRLRAAELLAISRARLLRRIEALGLNAPEDR